MLEKIMHASKVGFPCDRNLWYSVNGHDEVISERSQRIFDVGTSLEPLVIKWLEKDGWLVDYNPGSLNAEKKVFIKLPGGESLIGHPDAFIFKHISSPLILIDIKTMNERAFILWKREGTLKKYPQYVDQLHVYAKGLFTTTKIDKLAIVGVNKNNSDMHIDFFDYDENRTKEILERTERIVALEDAPEPGERMQDWCCSYCGYSWLCELFQKKHDTSVGTGVGATTDKNIIDAVELLKEARELSKAGEELENEAKKVLDENVRQKGIKEIQAGSLLLSLTESAGRATFDKKSFGKEYPELLKKFTSTGATSIRYNIKEI